MLLDNVQTFFRRTFSGKFFCGQWSGANVDFEVGIRRGFKVWGKRGSGKRRVGLQRRGHIWFHRKNVGNLKRTKRNKLELEFLIYLFGKVSLFSFFFVK